MRQLILKTLKSLLIRISGRSRYKRYTILGQKFKPMLRVIDEIKRRNIKVEELDALEMFGNDGRDHTTTYANVVKSLEVWEKDEKWYSQLVRNLPNAIIKIVDSYEEIKNSTNKYDFIVIDAPIGISYNHCEHFDLLPHLIFRITKDEALLVLNVIPDIDSVTLKIFPYLSSKEYSEKRADFYATDDPINISLNHMVNTYRRLIEKNNYQLLWAFDLERYKVYYLVLRIKKNF